MLAEGSRVKSIQVRELCALHALNNVFQERAFTKADLDGICSDLSPSTWLNPHRSWLGLGNYDVNVLTAALHKKAFDLVWFDKRKQPETIETENVTGFILNVPNCLKLGWVHLPVERRHWVALKEMKIGEAEAQGFYNLDSKLKEPQLLGDASAFLEYLRSELGGEKELFLVVSKEVSDSDSWKIDSSQ